MRWFYTVSGIQQDEFPNKQCNLSCFYVHQSYFAAAFAKEGSRAGATISILEPLLTLFWSRWTAECRCCGRNKAWIKLRRCISAFVLFTCAWGVMQTLNSVLFLGTNQHCDSHPHWATCTFVRKHDLVLSSKSKAEFSKLGKKPPCSWFVTAQ